MNPDVNTNQSDTHLAKTDTADRSWEFLAALAVLNPGNDDVTRMHETCARVKHWHDIAERAEVHGIAPLASHHIREHNIDVNQTTRRSLNALVLRHREADRILNQALEEILYRCHDLNLDVLVLKGSALAHLVYPSSGLRPRRDIDLLAAPDEALRVQQLLARIGYTTPDKHPTRAMRFHHHLPVASRNIDGMTVSIEVHRDALSGDYPQRLRMTTLHQRPQAFTVNGAPAWALNHRDMLHHLCRHALEPGEPTRLMSIADIIGYADYFHQQIDWVSFRQSHPHTVNALSHLHYVCPLPPSLASLRPDATARTPEGVGHNMQTLNQILQESAPVSDKLRDIVFPPAWWMRAYYGTEPDSSLNRVRLLKHLPRIVRWSARRVIAYTAG